MKSKTVIFLFAAVLLFTFGLFGCSDGQQGVTPSPNASGNGEDDPEWADDVFAGLAAPEIEPAAVAAIKKQTGLDGAPNYVRADTVITNDSDFVCDIDYGNGIVVKGIFFDSISFDGKTPKAYAVYGIPPGASAQNPAPGIVIVHGGGNGQAANPWQVSEWVKRGYAAIAISMGNQVYYHNTGVLKQIGADVYPGPTHYGFHTAWEKDPADVTTQWIYHAVCKNILGKRILESFPQVDADKIGIMGGSWGGMLTNTVAGLTDEFAFAVAVFGNGHQFDDPRSNFYAEMNENDGIGGKTWDASNFHYNVKTPVMFVTDDADYYTSAVATTKCFEEIRDARLLIKTDLPHDTNAYDALKEIPLYIKGVLGNKEVMPKVTKQPAKGARTGVKIKLSVPDGCFYSGADLYYVEKGYEYFPVYSLPGVLNPARQEINGGPLVNKFKIAAASAVTFDRDTGRAIADVPASAAGYYISFKFLTEELTPFTVSTALRLFE